MFRTLLWRNKHFIRQLPRSNLIWKSEKAWETLESLNRVFLAVSHSSICAETGFHEMSGYILPHIHCWGREVYCGWNPSCRERIPSLQTLLAGSFITSSHFRMETFCPTLNMGWLLVCSTLYWPHFLPTFNSGYGYLWIHHGAFVLSPVSTMVQLACSSGRLAPFPTPVLSFFVIGKAVWHLTDSTTAVCWQAEQGSPHISWEVVHSKRCISFYYETSQDLWDLFSSSVHYTACLHIHIVLPLKLNVNV